MVVRRGQAPAAPAAGREGEGRGGGEEAEGCRRRREGEGRPGRGRGEGREELPIEHEESREAHSQPPADRGLGAAAGDAGSRGWQGRAEGQRDAEGREEVG